MAAIGTSPLLLQVLLLYLLISLMTSQISIVKLLSSQQCEASDSVPWKRKPWASAQPPWDDTDFHRALFVFFPMLYQAGNLHKLLADCSVVFNNA